VLDGAQAVACDRLRLRAPILFARELLDHPRPGAVEIEHQPAAVGGPAHDELVLYATGLPVAPNRWVFHRVFSFAWFSRIAARA
jgi:hypothetical protein